MQVATRNPQYKPEETKRKSSFVKDICFFPSLRIRYNRDNKSLSAVTEAKERVEEFKEIKEAHGRKPRRRSSFKKEEFIEGDEMYQNLMSLIDKNNKLSIRRNKSKEKQFLQILEQELEEVETISSTEDPFADLH
eukprot:snap_masked-scaffold_33-processed-gene-2.24-mRNA-1 protein AED:0.16 eAED:1.00 QI:0/-1/0/1/-1/1/1/0/134